MDNKIDAKFLRHVPCPYCGSKDNVGEYEDHYHCFSPNCGKTWYKNEEEKELDKMYNKLEGERIVEPKTVELPGTINSIPDRRITAETCKKFGVHVTATNQGITEHFYPYYDKNGYLVAYKRREVAGKRFSWTVAEGAAAKDCVLFGMQAFPKGGRFVTITEGEMDAMACYQMFGGTGAYV